MFKVNNKDTRTKQLNAGWDISKLYSEIALNTISITIIPSWDVVTVKRCASKSWIFSCSRKKTKTNVSKYQVCFQKVCGFKFFQWWFRFYLRISFYSKAIWKLSEKGCPFECFTMRDQVCSLVFLVIIKNVYKLFLKLLIKTMSWWPCYDVFIVSLQMQRNGRL